MRTRTKLAVAATATAAVTAVAVHRHRSHADLAGRVALVSGGSRGLGRLIAAELAARGCRLVICARGAAELEVARRELAADGTEVLAVPGDVTERAQVDELVNRAVSRFGRLDILVNNAGIIRVGPVTAMTVEDHIAAVEVMQLGPVYLTLAALPHLRAAPAGRIVNITSIGGKVPVPHLLPYATAKSGAVGFSEGLRAELAPYGVSVTTVVPGLMRTGSHVHAVFVGQADKEYRWFATLARTPVVAMDARRAARRIVDAAAARRAEVMLTPLAMIASRVAGVAPATTARLVGVAARVLPRAPDSSPDSAEAASPKLGARVPG